MTDPTPARPEVERLAPYLHRVEQADLDGERVLPFPTDPRRAALIAAYAREHDLDEAAAREALDRAETAWHEVAQTLGRAAAELGEVIARAWRDVERAVVPATAHLDALRDFDDPRARALRARRLRGTGPPPARLDGRRR